MKSWLLPGGDNLFQVIKRVCQEAETSGQTLHRLSIGQPSGPALKSARDKCAEYTLSEDERWHEYQDNGCLMVPDFARRFAQAHVSTVLAGLNNCPDSMPIPGIKPMLGLLPLACGLARDGRLLEVGSMTKPGYPVPETWSRYLRVNHHSLKTNQGNAFRPDLENEEDIGYLDSARLNLAMLNFPHNPSGQIATREYWRKTCAFCEEKGIRLFNDGAYLALAHDKECCALADVAPEFVGLSWMEAYSASKSIANGTGWRVGAVVGSPDFVGDLRTVKGNTDSGFFAPAAGGALYALENDQDGIAQVRQMYGGRIQKLISLLTNRGLKLAVKPGAGFFTLWQAPKCAFGRKMEDAEDFNMTMIKETGIVGVHFDPSIRYAVCGPTEEWDEIIFRAFDKAKVSY